MVEMILSPQKVGFGIKHILIFSEIWDGVVHWMIWLSNGWGPGQKRLSLYLSIDLQFALVDWELVFI